MEEFLLGAFLAGEELDVVDEQGIDGAIMGLEGIHVALLQGLDHVADEALRVQVHRAGVGTTAGDHVTDGVHEVGLAQAHATVDEQRVVGGTGVLAHLHRGGLGQLVGLAFHEGIEGEVGIERGVAVQR